MIDVFGCCCKNNLICVGEFGVGKIVVVEGLVVKIVEGDVLDMFKNVELIGFDLGMLQVGVGVKGEFENCLKGIIDEVKLLVKLIILFIDEVYMLIGVGGLVGGVDVVNFFKFVFVCGELCIVVVMIWSEYKKYFEKDFVLEWCFQLVKFDELSLEQVIIIMCGLCGVYEKNYGVYICDNVVVVVVKLLVCYIFGC